MKTKEAILPISVVIPTYCEEEWLPRLLESLRVQVLKPQEIIVADAQSTDGTRDVAVKYGARVVEGGRIAVGRNAGARAAVSEYLLFLDADTVLPTEVTLGRAFLTYLKEGLDIASARYSPPKEAEPSFGKTVGAFFFGIWNIYTSIQNVFKKPIATGGAFILVKKSLFDAVGGFDEAINIGEDRDFFRRISEAGGKFKRLPLDVETSVRRFDTPEKIAKLIPWYVMNVLAIGLGAYAGSKAVKKWWKYYGRLGGGAGKDPSDET